MSSPSSVRIPSNVDMPDRVIGPLTARQLAILAVTGLVLYGGWAATRTIVPIPVFLVLATPIGAAATALALGRRDGLPLDRLLLAAIRQHLAPRYRVAAPEGVLPAPAWLTAATHTLNGAESERGRRGERIAPAPLRLPAEAIEPAGTGDVGILDLGSDGLAVVAVTSTVNFALRTAGEQEALVGSFARYLHSLTAPVQILVRTHRLDLSGAVAELRERAGGLPHPALETAALDHADYLAALGEQTELLRRQVLLVLHEPLVSTPADGLSGARFGLAARRRAPRSDGAESAGAAGVRQAAEFRLVRRLSEATELLAPAGIVVTALSAGEATAVLASSCNPDTLLPPNGELAAADEVITTPTAALSVAFDDPEAAPPRWWSTSPADGGQSWRGEDTEGYADPADDFEGYDTAPDPAVGLSFPTRRTR